jgi:hypothetical protein
MKEDKGLKPHGQTRKHQPENFKCKGKEVLIVKPIKVLHQLLYQSSLGKGKNILLSPSESPFVEHSTHPKKVYVKFFTFWVPLDLSHYIIVLQYETVACAYQLCFQVELFKVCLNM